MTILPNKAPSDGHLTKGAMESEARQTYPGMAHFAGTGPDGMTCRECLHYAIGVELKAGGRKPGSCGKYPRLAEGRTGLTKIPPNAAACKYFEPDPRKGAKT